MPQVQDNEVKGNEAQDNKDQDSATTSALEDASVETPSEPLEDAAQEAAAEPKRKGSHTALKVIIFIALAIVVDVALTFAFESYGNFTETVWYEYRQGTDAGERYDTIVLGPSVMQDGVQPGPIDEILGTNSFCLAGPGESPWASLKALRTALDEQHPIKRVIFGLSYTTLAEDGWPESDMAFVQAHARAASQTPLKVVAEYVELMLNPEYVKHFKSLAFLAPFTLNHCEYTPAGIVGNIRSRLESPTPEAAHERISVYARHLGKGYLNFDSHIDLNTFPGTDLAVNTLKSYEFNENKWGPVRQIVDLCEERGIELYVVSMPRPQFELIALSDYYPSHMAEVRDYVEAHGGTYLDFNLAKEWTFDPEADFLDGTHLSINGAARFSPILADTIARIERGEDVSGEFYDYDNWIDYLDSIEGITFVYTEQEEVGDDYRLTAHSYEGWGVQTEYEFYIEREEGEWEVIRPWSTEPSFVYSFGGYGTSHVLVQARRVGTTEPERAHWQILTHTELN